MKMTTTEMAVGFGINAMQAEWIADWHAERSDREGDRHDMISFRFRKIAADLRRFYWL